MNCYLQSKVVTRKLTHLEDQPRMNRIYVIVNTHYDCANALGGAMLTLMESARGKKHVMYATSDIEFASDIDCNWYGLGTNTIILPYVATHGIDQAAQNPSDICRASTRSVSFFFAGNLGRTEEGRLRTTVLRAMASQSSDAVVKDSEFSDITNYTRMALDYTNNLHRSQYCLVPAVDSPTSRRLFDALAAGCVPVYLGNIEKFTEELTQSGESNLPFPRTLDWSSLVVFAGSMECLHHNANLDAQSLGRELQRPISGSSFEFGCHHRVAAYSSHLSYFRNRSVATTLISEILHQRSAGYQQPEVLPLLHEGADCWRDCGNTAGYCDWCGAGNACCRGSGDRDPAECHSVATGLSFHSCVVPAASSKKATLLSSPLIASAPASIASILPPAPLFLPLPSPPTSSLSASPPPPAPQPYMYQAECALMTEAENWDPTEIMWDGALGGHHNLPSGCKRAIMPDFSTQSCKSVQFGTCLLKHDSEPEGKCARCAHQDQPESVMLVNTSEAHLAGASQGPIYLFVLCPPFMGSSALEGLLSASPEVTTICREGTWECEYTWLMTEWGIWKRPLRWVQPTSPEWYWSRVFNALENHHVWDYPRRRIRLMKSTADLGKVESLVAFMSAHSISYRFVLMHQHPCLISPTRGKMTNLPVYAHYFHKVVQATPVANLLMVSYEDLLTDTAGMARNLMQWLPELRMLDLHKAMEVTRNSHGKHAPPVPVLEYATSDVCSRRIQRVTALCYTADLYNATSSLRD